MNNYIKQRNRDFMNAVHKTIVSWDGDGTLKVSNIIKKVISSPAPDFYVSYETAYRYTSLAMRNKLPHNINGTRRQMWSHLARRVSALMRNNSSYSYAKALLTVLENGHAPSFYITAPTATRIYYNMTRKPFLLKHTQL